MWQVIGQDRAVSLLRRGLDAGSPAHAYLFIGPAHVGKMTLAINLAQAVNCGATEPPCGECDSCRRITAGKHADVQIIDLNQAGNLDEIENRVKIGVDQIEQLQHSASLPPFEGRYKVFVINGADLLSIGAANRLLKTLEEPVDRVIFILLAVDEKLLPMTITSRCQRVELLPMAIDKLAEIIKSKWGVEAEKARLLATLARGCPGWAISTMHDDRWRQQRDECIEEWLGIIDADIDHRFSYIARLAAQFRQNRVMVQGRLQIWLDWWRDLLVVAAGSGDIIYNVDKKGVLEEMARNYHIKQIRDYIDNIQATTQQLGQNANAQLVLEVMMLDMPEKHG